LKSFVLLAMACVPAAFAAELALPPVVLYARFQQAPSEAVTTALRKELDSVMAPAGIGFEWRSLDNVRGDAPAVELVVVSFDGNCGAGELLHRPSVGGVLGWTHVSEGTVLPFTEIRCDLIRRFVQTHLLELPYSARDQAFGRAVARVLAHELYHVFTGSRSHGRAGLAKSTYNALDLLEERFEFDARDAAVLRHSPFHAALEVSSGNAAVAVPETLESDGRLQGEAQ
jgi:hypothetical protein